MKRTYLLHLVRMCTNAEYRKERERRARFARIMAVNKSIVEDK